LRFKEQETRLTLREHDDDDDDMYKIYNNNNNNNNQKTSDGFVSVNAWVPVKYSVHATTHGTFVCAATLC